MKKVAIIILLALLVCLFSACPTDGNGNLDAPENDAPNQEEVSKMYITVYGNKL